MEASRFQIMQVFLFLLGQAAGYPVEKELENVEPQFKSRFPEVVDVFQRTAYELSVAIGKIKAILLPTKLYSRNARDVSSKRSIRAAIECEVWT